MKKYSPFVLGFALSAVVLSFVFANIAYAQTSGDGCTGLSFIPAIGIPGSPFVGGQETNIDCSSIGNYIKAIYTFAVYAGSILAAIVIMIGGFLWLTAGGNVNQVSTARTFIGGALSGVILLLLSWTILQMVNPALVRFKPLNITAIERRGITPVAQEYCCVCGGSGGGQAAECIKIIASVSVGLCTCPGREPTQVPSETACLATSSDCQFQENDNQMRDAAVQKDCEQRISTLDLSCSSSIVRTACRTAPQCNQVLKDRGEGGLCQPPFFSCPNNAVCNWAWDCKDDGVGSPRDIDSSPSSGSPCCRPRGNVGDLCTDDKDCLGGLSCSGDGYFSNSVGQCKEG